MYITRTQLQALCPKRQLDGALDDAGDGDVDSLLDALITAAETKVHALLGADYPAPLADPVPAVVIDAACTFAIYELWARNGFKAEENPRSKDASDAREMLKPYGEGTKKLYPPPPADDNLVAERNSLDSPYPMV